MIKDDTLSTFDSIFGKNVCPANRILAGRSVVPYSRNGVLQQTSIEISSSFAKCVLCRRDFRFDGQLSSTTSLGAECPCTREISYISKTFCANQQPNHSVHVVQNQRSRFLHSVLAHLIESGFTLFETVLRRRERIKTIKRMHDLGGYKTVITFSALCLTSTSEYRRPIRRTRRNRSHT